jgi:glycine/D-amino acid oxidase-like deaminating enzyme
MQERPLASASALKAVVLGGGMAGLAAAQALSSEFDEVVILERDTLQNCEVKIPPGRKTSGSSSCPLITA